MLAKNIKRRQLFILWYLAIFFFVVLLIHPISYGIMRLATVILGCSILLGAIFLFWQQKIIRAICLAFALVISALTLLPGREIDGNALREVYLRELNRYEGTVYVWGGENKLGIDCSGLVRQGLIQANLKQGLLTVNPDLIRSGISMWWHDAGADALRDEYRNLTKRGLKYESINKLDYLNIQKGDMAVTVDGEHILAYIGDKTWIEADPTDLKVIKVKIPEPNNLWFNVPVYALQWRQFESKTTSAFNSKAVAQTPPPAKPAPQEIVQYNQVRSLPGQLDTVPMFNSNSPEWIKTEGILLSTFPPNGKKVPAAHLNFPFQGDFTLFAHHFTHTPPNLQTLYTGAIVNNPGKETVTVKVLQAASYQMQEAPFKEKPPMVENPNGEVYSGPGIRAVDNVLRGRRQADFPAELVIPPGKSRMLLNHPTPVRGLEKPINGRSTFMRLKSSGKVYVASLTMYAKKNADGSDRPPTLQEWQQMLDNGGLAGPREQIPTPPTATSGKLIYGRAGGVQQGSKWEAILVDEGAKNLAIPQPNKAFSYVISTLRGGRLGTEQIQTAKMLARYPDTAYEAHGNYSVYYDLTLPLINPTDKPQMVTVTLETPLKEDRLSKGGLRFRKPPQDFPFFRGTVRLRYTDDRGKSQTRYLHLWHRFGQIVEPLVTLKLAALEARSLRVDFLYPPDSTPPQVLTVRTLE